MYILPPSRNSCRAPSSLANLQKNPRNLKSVSNRPLRPIFFLRSSPARLPGGGAGQPRFPTGAAAAAAQNFSAAAAIPSRRPDLLCRRPKLLSRCCFSSSSGDCFSLSSGCCFSSSSRYCFSSSFRRWSSAVSRASPVPVLLLLCTLKVQSKFNQIHC